MSVARDEFDRLVAEHGITGWRLEISRRITSACAYTYHHTKVIRIAEWHALSDDHDEIIDTVRHELAHAIAGAREKHGPKWQAWAEIMGARPMASIPKAAKRG